MSRAERIRELVTRIQADEKELAEIRQQLKEEVAASKKPRQKKEQKNV
ncbi:hypothetical protein [Bradyrhizobium liaoningense]|nr:hypothetical protein [Bradyrhizobium liaoningense]